MKVEHYTIEIKSICTYVHILILNVFSKNVNSINY